MKLEPNKNIPQSSSAIGRNSVESIYEDAIAGDDPKRASQKQDHLFNSYVVLNKLLDATTTTAQIHLTPMDATYVNNKQSNGDATFQVTQAVASSDATFVTKSTNAPLDNHSLMTEDNSHDEQVESPVPVAAVATLGGSKKKKELFKSA